MPGRALPGFFISAMSVIISGSVAYDTVFTHEGRFADAIRPYALDCLNLTFQACGMRRTFGGCAGNIAWSLKQLGGDPLIWSAMGCDAGPFLEHFRRTGIRTDGITVMPDAWSAQCVITTDSTGLLNAYSIPYRTPTRFTAGSSRAILPWERPVLHAARHVLLYMDSRAPGGI